MTLADLVEALRLRFPRATKTDLENVARDTVREMANGVYEDGVLALRNLGTFTVRTVAAQRLVVRTPGAEWSIHVPARKLVRFRAVRRLAEGLTAITPGGVLKRTPRAPRRPGRAPTPRRRIL